MKNVPALLAFLTMGLVGCATLSPSTGYVESDGKNNAGYFYTPVDSSVYGVAYVGNSRTRVSAAYAYTVLAGYEKCTAQNKIAYVAPPEDYSKDHTETRVSSYPLAMYSPYGGTSYTSQVYSYNVNWKTPAFLSSVFCRSHFRHFSPGPKFESIKAELVHDVTKDFHGAVLVKDPGAGKSALHADDAVIRVNGARVETALQIEAALEAAKSESAAPVEVIRSQKIVKLKVPVKDYTSLVAEVEKRMTEKLCRGLPRQEAADTGGFDKRDIPTPGICAAYPPAKIED